jgi:hypothetical protein
MGKMDQVEASRKHEEYLKHQIKIELDAEILRCRDLVQQLADHEVNMRKVRFS